MDIKRSYLSVFESIRFALQAIRSNILRTALSLSGIMIGVFCIIAILTLVDSIKLTVESSISKLGDKTLYIQRWPWLFEADYPWWKYVNRKPLSYREMQNLRKKIPEAEAIAFDVSVSNNKLTWEGNSAEEVSVVGISDDFLKVRPLTIDFGRFFTDEEIYNGSKKVVLGYELATNLFDNPALAIGKSIKLLNSKAIVVGVLKKEGNGIGVGRNQDDQAFLSVNFLRNVVNFDNTWVESTIYVIGGKDLMMSKETFEDKIRGYMRLVRKLKPRDEDDFAMNKITMITSVLDKVFSQINSYGWVIAGFSILVGGFGVANIMFVSVKERTSIIGVQKALGAPKIAILSQFLAESIILCILGGGVGILLIWILVSVLNTALPFQLILTLENASIGLALSSFIGILSGMIPSIQAANLDPIQAIRSNQ